MRFYNLSSGQTALVAIILASAVVLTLIYNQFLLRTPAEKAIRSGSLSRLEQALARQPALVNRPSGKDKFTPLHWAVMDDQTNMVRLLLDRGAEVEAADRHGRTPLHTATSFNRVALAGLLLDHGANPLAFAIKYGVIRFAPIHLAAEAGFAEMVRIFLDRDVDVNLRTQGKNQVTPLHIAAAKGQAEVVELLLKSGAEVNARDAAGATPLRWARKAEQAEVIDMLKIYGGEE